MPQLPQNRFKKNRRRIRKVTLEFILPGFGSLCLGCFSIFLWLSSSDDSFLSRENSDLPTEDSKAHSLKGRKIALPIEPEPAIKVDRVIGKILNNEEGEENLGDLSDVSALESLRLTLNALSLVAAPGSKVDPYRVGSLRNEGVKPPLPPGFHESDAKGVTESTDASSGKEVVAPSFHESGKEVFEPLFHDSGKEVLEFFGNGSGSGGLGGGAESGGMTGNEIAGAAGEEGKRRAVPYVPINVGSGVGYGTRGGDAIGLNSTLGKRVQTAA